MSAFPAALADPAAALRTISRYRAEQSLAEFVRQAWGWIDPSPYQENWHIEAMCQHLEAVTQGRIKRLLMNVPPRASKTTITMVCWPAWIWAQPKKSYLSGPQVRFLCGSYGDRLGMQSSLLMRRLIESPWYQENWGERVVILQDMNTKMQYDNNAGGSRAVVSVGGSLVGLGGDIVLNDDPHNTERVESEAERATTLNWWREISTTRLNSQKQSAIVVIMQRLHSEDVSGHILSEGGDEWVHLCIPMLYDPLRHCETVLGWADPRGLDSDGEMLPGIEVDVRGQSYIDPDSPLGDRIDDVMDWNRFTRPIVEGMRRDLGRYMFAGRMQQSPYPKGGGIILEEWWQFWEDETFPDYGTCIASLDTSFKEKESNDYNALTVWAAFEHPDSEKPKLMLRGAYRKRCGLHELAKDVLEICRKNKVQTLLVEDATRGTDVTAEIYRLIGHRREMIIKLIPPAGDKVGRINACVPIFENGVVYAPNREWAQMVIDEVLAFPNGKHDDLVDTVSQALIYLRATGVAVRMEEHDADEFERRQYRKQMPAVYDV